MFALYRVLPHVLLMNALVPRLASNDNGRRQMQARVRRAEQDRGAEEAESDTSEDEPHAA